MLLSIILSQFPKVHSTTNMHIRIYNDTNNVEICGQTIKIKPG